jgi:hypothetical protein
MRPATTFVASVLVLALAGAAFAGLTKGGQGRTSSHKSGLKVSGRVEGLYPGAVQPLPVRVRSRYPYPIRIRQVHAKVSDANFGCPKEKLSVTSWRGRVKVRPGRSRLIPLQVLLSPTALDPCQGATFPLKFKARATK